MSVDEAVAIRRATPTRHGASMDGGPDARERRARHTGVTGDVGLALAVGVVHLSSVENAVAISHTSPA